MACVCKTSVKRIGNHNLIFVMSIYLRREEADDVRAYFKRIG